MTVVKHNCIEAFCFCLELAVSGIVEILNQLLFANICERDYKMASSSCQTNASINDQIHKTVAGFSNFKLILELLMGAVGPLVVLYILLVHKTISIISVYIVGHVICVISMLLYDAFAVMSHLTLVCITGCCYFLSFGSLLIVIYDYISAKSTVYARPFRFLLIMVCCKMGYMSNNILYGNLIEYFGFQTALNTIIVVLFISTILFLSLEDFVAEPNSAPNDCANEKEMYEKRDRSLEVASRTIREFVYQLKNSPREFKVAFIFNVLYIIVASVVMYCRFNITSLYLLNKNLMASAQVLGSYLALRIMVTSLGAASIISLNHQFEIIAEKHLVLVVAASTFLHEILFSCITSMRGLLFIIPLDLGSEVIRILLSAKVSVIFGGFDRTIFFAFDLFTMNLFGHLGALSIFSIYSASVEKHQGLIFRIISVICLLEGIFSHIFFYFCDRFQKKLIQPRN